MKLNILFAFNNYLSYLVILIVYVSCDVYTDQLIVKYFAEAVVN
jgi:hypothetical protein